MQYSSMFFAFNSVRKKLEFTDKSSNTIDILIFFV